MNENFITMNFDYKEEGDFIIRMTLIQITTFEQPTPDDHWRTYVIKSMHASMSELILAQDLKLTLTVLDGFNIWVKTTRKYLIRLGNTHQFIILFQERECFCCNVTRDPSNR